MAVLNLLNNDLERKIIDESALSNSKKFWSWKERMTVEVKEVTKVSGNLG